MVIEAYIAGNKKLTEDVFLMGLQAYELGFQTKPGQFIRIKCGDLLLWRPFCTFTADDGYECLVYKVIGRGTTWLSQRKSGDKLEIAGPLGKGFKIDEESVGHYILLAGGTGLASVSRCYNELMWRDTALTFLVGVKTGKEIVPILQMMAIDFRSDSITTEDGTLGQKGVITDLLTEKLRENSFKASETVIYAAGPPLMLKEVARIANVYNIECQVSLEARMACGAGACRGCVVKTISGYKRVCADGPVFDAKEVDWDEYTKYESKDCRT